MSKINNGTPSAAAESGRPSILDLHAAAGRDLARWVVGHLSGGDRRERAEDVVQDVWLRVMELVHRGSVERRNRPWLFNVAKHVLHEHHRAVSRSRCLSLPSCAQTTPDRTLNRLIADEESNVFRRLLRSLTEHERELIAVSAHRGALRRRALLEGRSPTSLVKRVERIRHWLREEAQRGGAGNQRGRRHCKSDGCREVTQPPAPQRVESPELGSAFSM